MNEQQAQKRRSKYVFRQYTNLHILREPNETEFNAAKVIFDSNSDKGQMTAHQMRIGLHKAALHKGLDESTFSKLVELNKIEGIAKNCDFKDFLNLYQKICCVVELEDEYVNMKKPVMATSSKNNNNAKRYSRVNQPIYVTQYFNQKVKEEYIIKAGYLEKLGAKVQNWKTRYFKLHGACPTYLSYYKNKEDKEPVRSIDISDAKVCAS